MKPSNILLAADGIPRVADCRLTGGPFPSPPPASHRAPDQIAYLAPELVSDPGMELRPSMDIYSLGAILYELLTGRTPLAEETPRDSSQDGARPSLDNPDVTPYLEMICMRCLRQSPWQRYSRSYNLLMSLRAFLADPTSRDLSGRGRHQERDRG